MCQVVFSCITCSDSFNLYNNSKGVGIALILQIRKMRHHISDWWSFAGLFCCCCCCFLVKIHLLVNFVMLLPFSYTIFVGILCKILPKDFSFNQLDFLSLGICSQFQNCGKSGTHTAFTPLKVSF